MNWFESMCRNLGLTIHHIVKPAPGTDQKRKVVKKTVEEEKISDTVTMRRTTIEEIEIKKSQT